MTQRDIERTLAAEGLAPLDTPGGMVSSRGGADSDPAGGDEAHAAYFEWARSLVLARRTRFLGRRSDAKGTLDAVWKLHAEERTQAEIAVALGLTRVAVQKAIRRVVQLCGPPPLLNPLQRSGRLETEYQRADPVALARLARLAVRLAPVGRLREAIAGDPVLTRLLPQEGTYMSDPKEKRPVALVHYDSIRLRSGEGVQVPGNPVKKDQLIDIEGRPHAGGIDIQLPIMKGDVQVATKVVMVPWWKIASTERTLEAVE